MASIRFHENRFLSGIRKRGFWRIWRFCNLQHGLYLSVYQRAFVELLQSYNVEISIDGIGRCKGNIFVERIWRTLKYEWIFLRDYSSAEELRKSLGQFVKFFNSERIHQGLEYKTPDEFYEEGSWFFSLQELSYVGFRIVRNCKQTKWPAYLWYTGH